MRILVNINKVDFRFGNLVKPLEKLDIALGVVVGKLDKDVIDRFNPDIVIHNGFLKSDGFIEIPIGDITYSLLGPFTALSSSEVDVKYNSDICYIGDVKDFGNDLYQLMDQYNFKLFSHIAYSFPSYCGNLTQENTGKAYKNAKVSVVPVNDFGYREMDIIVSDGNPVKFQNKDQFFSDVHDGVNGKKFTTNYTKEEILEKHTNYDKLSKVFKDIGLTQLASQVKELK